MSKEFKIDYRHQYKSIKEGLIFIAFIPITFIVAYVTGSITWENYTEFIYIFLPVYLVFFLPAFFLHFTYYLTNRNTSLIVDNHLKHFSGTHHQSSFDFSFNDIKWVEQHLSIYYKNQKDNRMRRTAPWTSYGYLKLKLKNGEVYYFYSLMLDIQHPPFSVSQTKYRFLPFIEKQNPSIAPLRELVTKKQQEKFSFYLQKFADLPKEQLLHKVDNFARYEAEAIAAAKKLLEYNKKETTANLEQ